jgi:hypothetical protein
MPLKLTFSTHDGRQETLGPLKQAYFQGETLKEEPASGDLARHKEHVWLLNHRQYIRIDCEARVHLFFCSEDGDASREYGPFEHFSSVDGVAYADRNVFARVDQQIGDWYSMQEGRHWQALCVRPLP